MKKIKQMISILITALLITSLSAPCFAAGNAFKDIYEDSLYGGLAGTLVGAAVMAFTKRPKDHLDYIIYGAAGGVLVGATYGIITTTRSLAQMENGKVIFAMPTIIPEFPETNAKGQTAFVLKAELFRGRF